MEFSVKKRINRILEDIQRTQQLAGLSDPQQGVVAPANAYEDDFAGLENRFGKQIINKLVLYVRTQLNTPITLVKTDNQDLSIKILNTQDTGLEKLNDGNCFIRFGGYMQDSKNYNFSIGYMTPMGQTIFLYKFTMDIDGNINNWQALKF